MMQAAKPWHCDDPACHIRSARRFTTVRRSLIEPEMCPVVVVVTDIFSHQSFQMPFIDDNHMVEQVSPAAADPSLCDGLRKLVRLGLMPKLFTVSITSSLKFDPRSKIR